MADDMRLREIVGENRAKLDGLEREIDRLRESVHELRAELATLRYLAREVSNMAQAIKDLGGELKLISRRAIERPTARTWQASASMISAVVALIALIVALRR